MIKSSGGPSAPPELASEEDVDMPVLLLWAVPALTGGAV